jgi:protein ImuA
MPADRDALLTDLLQHPQLWRARGAAQARRDALPTGLENLDALLPDGGWPACGLVELLVERTGVGELSLIMPALAQSLREDRDAWVALIAPPHEPYAPALAARGIDLQRVLVVRTTQVLWAMEQALRSSAFAVVLGWVDAAPARGLRRLKLAAGEARTLVFLFRHARCAVQPSPAELRLRVTPHSRGLEAQLLKSRGGRPGTVDLPLQSTCG